MRFAPIIAGVTLAMAAPVCATAPEVELSAEEKLAQCIGNAQPDLLFLIRDAASEEQFIAAFDRGLELCPTDVEHLSMGRFFTAVQQLLDVMESEQ